MKITANAKAHGWGPKTIADPYGFELALSDEGGLAVICWSDIQLTFNGTYRVSVLFEPADAAKLLLQLMELQRRELAEKVEASDEAKRQAHEVAAQQGIEFALWLQAKAEVQP